jgi:hypothetical protein
MISGARRSPAAPRRAGPGCQIGALQWLCPAPKATSAPICRRFRPGVLFRRLSPTAAGAPSACPAATARAASAQAAGEALPFWQPSGTARRGLFHTSVPCRICLGPARTAVARGTAGPGGRPERSFTMAAGGRCQYELLVLVGSSLLPRTNWPVSGSSAPSARPSSRSRPPRRRRRRRGRRCHRFWTMRGCARAFGVVRDVVPKCPRQPFSA